MEESLLRNSDSSILVDKMYPRYIAQFNCIISTDVERGCFKYLKNRYTGETDVNIPLSELPKHIRRMNANLGYPITWYDRIHRYVWYKTVDFFDWLRV